MMIHLVVLQKTNKVSPYVADKNSSLVMKTAEGRRVQVAYDVSNAYINLKLKIALNFGTPKNQH